MDPAIVFLESCYGRAIANHNSANLTSRIRKESEMSRAMGHGAFDSFIFECEQSRIGGLLLKNQVAFMKVTTLGDNEKFGLAGNSCCLQVEGIERCSCDSSGEKSKTGEEFHSAELVCFFLFI